MKILDRYVAREFLRFLGLVLATFVVLYLLIDFFEKIRMFMSNAATVRQVVTHFLYTIPMIVTQTLPAAVLLASLITFGTLSRHGEITAMKAGGISLYRIAAPVVAIAAAICGLLFLFSEYVTPKTYEKAEYIRLVEVQKKESLGTFKQNAIWYRGKDGIYNFKFFDVQRNEIQGITIHYLKDMSEISMRIDAERAEWKDGKWIFHNLLITRFPKDDFPQLERVRQQVVAMPETPADFQVVQKNTEEMGFFELREFVRKLQSEGYDATRYIVDMHGKVAFSLVSLILAVIGAAFSVRSERSGGVVQSIGAGIVLGFSYWIIFAFGLSLGRSGTIPPLLAAWSANLLFGAGAVFLFKRLRT
ncbi:MAG TPA: LPS export ABC transporter permease LptG [Syntrophales bacterium]|nr:LPS export ABC transporter permease LptG [Syntrophales bacterium]